MNVNGLRGLYEDNKTAQVVLDYFATRTRGTSLAVDRLLEELETPSGRPRRAQVISVLRELAELECGKFVTGRRGSSSRFEFSVPIAEVGGSARGDRRADQRDEEVVAIPPPTLNHVYRLRPDYVIELGLPSDLSASEASRLAEFVKTLPFQQ